MPTVRWTLAKRNRFAKALIAAIDNGADSNSVFQFEGNEYVVAYARYLLEYLAILDKK